MSYNFVAEMWVYFQSLSHCWLGSQIREIPAQFRENSNL